ncbi:MAG TPA: flagellar basal body L-ring protein FlgH [Terriglobia bacterium]|nr:flagellar basal body L-ring protein FlgH [Terriglobia bacterium]
MRQITRQSLSYFTLVLLVASSAGAANTKKDKNVNDMAADSLAQYIERVRATTASSPTLGSLWVPQGRFSNLPGDDKARNVNDTIIINVVEQTTAAADSSVKSARTFAASSSISALAGLVKANNGLQNLFSPQSSQALNGQAQTASDSSLVTSLAAQVVSVLPNGFLVIEAVRRMEMNSQRQTLLIHGVVRPSDIAVDNSVLSSQISNLEVRLVGKGVLSDGARPPNKLISAILKLVGF